MIFTREHNHLLPQTQEAWIAFYEAKVQEWERIYKEEAEYPTWDEAAQSRAAWLYKCSVRQLAACRSGSTEGLRGDERSLWEKGGLL